MRFLKALGPYLINHVFRWILTSLGISMITYVGFDILISQFKTQIMMNMSGVPAGLLQMFYLSGGGVVLNIIFGMFAFAATFKTMKKFGIGKK